MDKLFGGLKKVPDEKLHDAVRAGDHKLVCKALRRRSSATMIDCRDNDGRTPLQIACSTGHAQISTTLLDSGANPETVDNEGRTPLMVAAQKNYKLVVETLIEKGADARVRHSATGATALHFALGPAKQDKYEEVVRVLLRDSDVNATIMPGGHTPLMLAVENMHLKCAVHILNTRRVDANIRDANGRSLLFYAVEANLPALVRELVVVHNADTSIRDIEGRTASDVAAQLRHLDCLASLGEDKPTQARESEDSSEVPDVADVVTSQTLQSQYEDKVTAAASRETLDKFLDIDAHEDGNEADVEDEGRFSAHASRQSMNASQTLGSAQDNSAERQGSGLKESRESLGQFSSRGTLTDSRASVDTTTQQQQSHRGSEASLVLHQSTDYEHQVQEEVQEVQSMSQYASRRSLVATDTSHRGSATSLGPYDRRGSLTHIATIERPESRRSSLGSEPARPAEQPGPSAAMFEEVQAELQRAQDEARTEREACDAVLEQLQLSQADCVRLRESIHDLEEEKQKMAASLAAHQADEEELLRVRAHLKSKERECDNLTNDLREMRRKLQEAELDYARESAKLKARIANLESADSRPNTPEPVVSVKNRINFFKVATDAPQELPRAAEPRVKGVKTRINMFEDKIGRSEDTSRVHMQQLQARQMELKSKDEELARLRKQVKTLKEQVEDKPESAMPSGDMGRDEEVVRLKFALREKQAEITRLTSEFDEVRRNMDQTVEEFNCANEELKAQVAALQNAPAAPTRTHDDKYVEQLLARVAELENKLAATRPNTISNGKETEMLKSRIAELEEKLSSRPKTPDMPRGASVKNLSSIFEQKALAGNDHVQKLLESQRDALTRKYEQQLKLAMDPFAPSRSRISLVTIDGSSNGGM